MLKKTIISSILVVLILSGLYWYKTNHASINHKPAQETASTYQDRSYEYDVADLPKNCQLNSEMACAVDFAIKCTLDPHFEGCLESKLPRFIFMEDENLERPTHMSFKINKIKPISPELVELHTDSQCNGNWFGLCQGRVIYVLVPEQSSWRVKDIYALEN